VDINTRARYNYSGWCSPKGTGTIPIEHRKPGAAVFIHSTTENAITHVGFLDEPVDPAKPGGDWYVIEAKGVLYGVVRTKMNGRGWNRWGLMTKYYDYGDDARTYEPELGSRMLEKSSVGPDVKELQETLISLGYSCGKWGADGDFGGDTETAVKAFQHDEGLIMDGKYGPKTHEALTLRVMASETREPESDLVTPPVAPPLPSGKRVVVTGNSVNLRVGPGTEYDKAGVVYKGDALEYANANEWLPVKRGGALLWISGAYAKLEGMPT